jgi:hypothetical protein
VGFMGNAVITKAARSAARQATTAAQEELARRTRCNAEDLARFFSAREREDAVRVWLNVRMERLVAQAQARRNEQRRQCGVALGAMRGRGEQLRDIAHMAGVSEKTVRDLLKAAEGVPVPGGGDPAPVTEPAAAVAGSENVAAVAAAGGGPAGAGAMGGVRVVGVGGEAVG